MNINRSKSGITHTGALAMELAALQGPCVGCTECDGLCAALIDALTVPDVILSKKHESQ